MADSLGALQEQAAEIPYKNIAVNTSAVDGFINAWSTATQLKLKRQEVEGRMAALATKNQQLEFADQMREKMFAMRTENAAAAQNIALQRLDMEKDKMGQALFLANRTQDYRDAAQQFQVGKYYQQTEAQQNIYEGLRALESEKGKPGYDAKVDELFAQNPGAARSWAARTYAGAHQDHTKAWDQNNRSLETERKNITDYISHHFYGAGNKGDPSILEAQNKYFVQHFKLQNKFGAGRSVPEEMKNEIDSETNKPYRDEFKRKPDNSLVADPKMKSFRYIDPTAPEKPQYKPVATQTLNELTNRWKTYNEQKTAQGSRPYNLEAGVTAYQPGDKDIEALQNDPGLKRKFEARFGAGSSDPYLNNGTGE